jgi:hypothetical protein
MGIPQLKGERRGTWRLRVQRAARCRQNVFGLSAAVSHPSRNGGAKDGAPGVRGPFGAKNANRFRRSWSHPARDACVVWGARLHEGAKAPQPRWSPTSQIEMWEPGILGGLFWRWTLAIRFGFSADGQESDRVRRSMDQYQQFVNFESQKGGALPAGASDRPLSARLGIGLNGGWYRPVTSLYGN